MFFLILLALFFYYLNAAYINIWHKFSNKTANGSGIFLIIPLITYCTIAEINIVYILILLLFSLIYFLDDLINLNFLLRIFIQILTSFTIYHIFYINFNIYLFFLIIIIFFLFMNILNFQDGQDLNLFVLLVMIFTSFYFFSNNNISIQISLLVLIFLSIFSIFNQKAKNLYFGDSGCFIASILIFVIIFHEYRNLFLIKSIISIILFPSIDVFYVIFYRIYKKENLLTRNYYHIYQILYKKFKIKLYLLPNFIIGLFNLYIISEFLFTTNLIFFLFFINLFFCLLIHLIINKLPNFNEN